MNTLTAADISLVKSMLNPPAGVRLVMSAVCIMLGIAPDRVKDLERPGKKIDDFWESSQKEVTHQTGKRNIITENGT